nr:MAG TPA: hypothetical protein [Caudoviricetes sp.]DAZ26763.1 MAG TPA: hypothetical protein [Caudoviricetes sp.]
MNPFPYVHKIGKPPQNRKIPRFRNGIWYNKE